MLVGYTGPMFAQKSTSLLSNYRKLIISGQGETTMMVKHAMDQRYTQDALNVSHDGVSMQALPCHSLVNELTDDTTLQGIKTLLIDEMQFFMMEAGTLEWVLHQVNDCKRTIIWAGLSLKADMSHWEGMADLSMHCDRLHHLRAICALCCKEAAFTRYITSGVDVKVGGNDHYIPTCRQCHTDPLHLSPETLRNYQKRVETAVQGRKK